MVLVPYIKYHINNDIGSSNIGDSDNSNISKGGIDNRNCSYSLCLLMIIIILDLIIVLTVELAVVLTVLVILFVKVEISVNEQLDLESKL